jgi:large subunit ribosomal protein L22
MAVETKEYRAEAKFQRVSPQKARLVLDLIKGRGVEEALATAAFTKKRIAPVIHKLLTSAVDNAKYVAGEQGVDLDVDSLYVKSALANDGPRMKRIRPAPMGRAYRYQRRMSHIIISVAEKGGANLAVTVGEDSEVSAAPVKSRAKKLVAAAKKSTTGKKAAPGGAAKHPGGHKDHKGGGHTAGSKKTTEKKTGKKNK